MRQPTPTASISWIFAAILAAPSALAGPGAPDEQSLPLHLIDRGTGVPITTIGTYVRDDEWLVMPFIGYASDSNFQYDPNEFGFPSLTEYEGKYSASEGGLLIAYGLSDRIALELRIAGTDVSLDKAAADLSGMPATRKESGLGVIKLGLDWRWLTESGQRPEIFSYVVTSIAHDQDKPLAGTPESVTQLGIGAIRGFSWGTVTLRTGALYEPSSTSTIDWGNLSLEYLKRLSSSFTLAGSVALNEGDEGTLTTELQWRVNPTTVIKFNNGLGFTSPGLDWAPQIGVLLSLPGH